jgi:uncharacterized YccA/Bax inhibitor family protein
MKVTNPYFKQASASNEEAFENNLESTSVCTKTGIALKTLFCIVAAFVAGLIVAIFFNKLIYDSGSLSDSQIESMLARMISALMICVIIAFIAALVGRIAPKTAVVCAPLYSIGEGATIGCLCAMCELYVPGITVAAGVGTGLIFLLSLGAYALGLKKKMGTVLTFISVFLLAAIISSLSVMLFQVISGQAVSTGIILAIEIIYLAYAAFCLMANFKEVEMIVESGSDKKYEWSVALGLVISILYLFVELIRIILIIVQMNSKN